MSWPGLGWVDDPAWGWLTVQVRAALGLPRAGSMLRGTVAGYAGRNRMGPGRMGPRGDSARGLGQLDAAGAGLDASRAGTGLTFLAPAEPGPARRRRRRAALTNTFAAKLGGCGSLI